LIKARVLAEQLDLIPLKAAVEKNFACLHIEEGNLQKAFESLEHAEALAQKIESREIMSEALLVRGRAWIILGDVKRAREAQESATALVEAYNLKRLLPSLGILLGEVLAMEKNPADAMLVLQHTAQLAKKYRQRRLRVEAQLGLVQLQRSQKTASQVSVSLYHIEKEVRALGLRKLKLKLLAIKGILSREWNGSIDNRFLNSSLHGVAAAGYSIFEKQLLDVAGTLAKEGHENRDAEMLGRNLKLLLEKGAVDLHLVRPRSEWNATIPVSITV
jgi:tetratricopeptide (TPR) repeat protein